MLNLIENIVQRKKNQEKVMTLFLFYQALQGGQMHHGHFEMLRLGLNRKMDDTRMFAMWRIEAPWKPITKKGLGHRMGGGKGNIDHYVTTVRAGRIILEFGGHCEFNEAYELLIRITKKLPFHANVVSQEILDEERKQGLVDQVTNLNPYSFQYCAEKNMFGCKTWMSPYDFKWFGKHR